MKSSAMGYLLIRRLCLLLLCLMPLTTLVYRDELGRWAQNRTCMAAPDEPSYFLMAQALSHDGTLNITSLAGRDTFYPVGWPGLLALLTQPLGLSRFTAHAAAAALLAVVVIQVYKLAKREIRNAELALLTAGVFATNWFVLDGSVFIFSEPAFTMFLLAWLSVGLARPDWPVSRRYTVVLTVLAIAASAMRAAGIVCLAAMVVYAAGYLLYRKEWAKLAVRLAIIAVIFVSYHAVMHHLSPERSLAAAAHTDNSYSKQLLNGLTNDEYQKQGIRALLDVHRLAKNLAQMGQEHLTSFAESLIPPTRETPRFGPYAVLSKLMLLVAVFGCLTVAPKQRMLAIFLAFYAALYILWPFDMIRFWTPALPVVLIFLIQATKDRLGVANWHGSYRMAGLLLFLLLAMNLQELALKQVYWLRRLNYVSETLATTAAAIRKDAAAHHVPPVVVAPGRDEAFSFAIYMNEPEPAGLRPLSYPLVPPPMSPENGQSLTDCVAGTGMETVWVVSYFAHPDIEEALAALDPKQFRVTKVHQREIIAAAWRVEKFH